MSRILIVAVIPAFFIGCPFSSSTPTPPTVTAVGLDKAYRSSQTSADETFGGKTVVVTGVVKRLGEKLLEDRSKTYWLNFEVEPGKDGLDRTMRVNLSGPPPATLSEGDVTSIRGKVRGWSEFDDVVIDEASIE